MVEACKRLTAEGKMIHDPFAGADHCWRCGRHIYCDLDGAWFHLDDDSNICVVLPN